MVINMAPMDIKPSIPATAYQGVWVKMIIIDALKVIVESAMTLARMGIMPCASHA